MAPHPTSSPQSPDGSLFAQPRPRPPKSEDELARIRIQNRRREWLERNPSYFSSLEHEFADPLLYDALVRRFQTISERQGDAKRKGYSRVLEGDLRRGEAKLAKMAEEYLANGQHGPQTGEHSRDAATQAQKNASEALEIDPPTSKEDALERWKDFLRDRFIRGEDEDFDYSWTDHDEQFDVVERRDREEEWFDDEEPSWASEGSDEDGGKQERMLEGETGVQDY